MTRTPAGIVRIAPPFAASSHPFDEEGRAFGGAGAAPSGTAVGDGPALTCVASVEGAPHPSTGRTGPWLEAAWMERSPMASAGSAVFLKVVNTYEMSWMEADAA
jgi:hypothetical protein